VVDIIDCTGSDDVIVKQVVLHDVLCYLSHIYNYMNHKEEDWSTESTEIEDSTLISIYSEFSDCKFYKGFRSLRSFMSKRSYNGFKKQQQNIIDNVVLNVIVYKDGINNSVCIVDYDGVSNNYIIMEEYQFSQEYGKIPIGDNLYITFGFHLYDSLDSETQICSLVFDTGSHATHVAGIIGGSFPDEKMNGVNPHCKILSLKIGDSRVDGMETSSALIRALQELVKHNCHIVNYSFGEPVSGDKGRFMDILDEYAFKHNIVFVTSAGNSGPGMGTVGAPGVISDRTLNVGAYTNATYLKSLYYMSENSFQGGVYEWSSRGPSINDGMGVSVIAAGCALTSHPRWNSSTIKMCNGTSMAAPNAAGFISLILSQFKDPSNYPHVYWMLRYVESTCMRVSDKDLETFGQGHGLIGQKHMNIKTYFGIKPCTYYYDVCINNNMSKKGILNFNESDDSTSKSDYTIEVKLNPLPNTYCKEFRVNEAIHKLIMTSSELDIDDVRFVSHVDSRPVRISIPNIQYSGHINIYEIITDSLGCETQRYSRSISVNQYKCKPIKISESVLNSNKTILRPGKIERMYLQPKGNMLSVKLNGDIKNKVTIDVLQYYNGTGYDKRSSDKVFTSNQSNMTLTANIIPNVPTEVCIYTSWTASCDEIVNINITCENKDVSISKYLFEMSEKVPIVIGRYGGEPGTIPFKETISLTQIVTKYHPFKAELFDTDSRYVNKDGNKLKLLKLSYNINKHPKCTYYINTNNKVYDSQVHMSGCISGFCNERKVFFANYIPKKVNNAVDNIIIEFMDSDVNVLKECINTVLTASRSPSIPIESSHVFKHGFNLVDISTKDISKLNNIYDGDYLQYQVLNVAFLVMYEKQLNLKISGNLNDKNISKEDTYNRAVKRRLTDFTSVKSLINKVSNLGKNNKTPVFCENLKEIPLNNDDMEVIDTSLCSVDSDSFNATDKKERYNKILNMSIMDRNNHEYIGTLFFETNCDDDNERFKKRLKTTHQHFSEQKLLKIPPFAVIDLAQCIVDKKNVLSDIDNKMDIVSILENNMDYWDNCNIKDLNMVRESVIKGIDLSQISTLGDKKYLLEYKRKCELMLETNEKVF
jgi:hypothetical protein